MKRSVLGWKLPGHRYQLDLRDVLVQIRALCNHTLPWLLVSTFLQDHAITNMYVYSKRAMVVREPQLLSTLLTLLLESSTVNATPFADTGAEIPQHNAETICKVDFYYYGICSSRFSKET